MPRVFTVDGVEVALRDVAIVVLVGVDFYVDKVMVGMAVDVVLEKLV